MNVNSKQIVMRIIIDQVFFSRIFFKKKIKHVKRYFSFTTKIFRKTRINRQKNVLKIYNHNLIKLSEKADKRKKIFNFLCENEDDVQYNLLEVSDFAKFLTAIRII